MGANFVQLTIPYVLNMAKTNQGSKNTNPISRKENREAIERKISRQQAHYRSINQTLQEKLEQKLKSQYKYAVYKSKGNPEIMEALRNEKKYHGEYETCWDCIYLDAIHSRNGLRCSGGQNEKMITGNVCPNYEQKAITAIYDTIRDKLPYSYIRDNWHETETYFPSITWLEDKPQVTCLCCRYSKPYYYEAYTFISSSCKCQFTGEIWENKTRHYCKFFIRQTKKEHVIEQDLF